ASQHRMCAMRAESESESEPAPHPAASARRAVAGPAALPLRWHTPAAWAPAALVEPLALLADHAHLERKAASNALDLLTRWGGAADASEWVRLLAAVARDETRHLQAVTRLLAQRGGTLPRVHRNSYAAALHGHIRRGDGTRELLDRLLVAALIEARSCERFALLAGVDADPALAAFFAALHGSERGHYRVFLRLAGDVVTAPERDRRWFDWLDIEAAIIAREAPGPRIHSGPPR
ncbi:MAG: tRNA isopentenyl-2-thiomethyl-A-37 hydroxylase MiaE, partial [Gammaproteobacteria bacterium]